LRRTSILILALSVFGAALATGAAATTKRPPKPTLQVLSTHRYGAILIDSSGYMVYGFALDKRNTDVCQSEHECLSQWPPLLAPHKLVLGRGVRGSLVHSIRLKNGQRQLTYNGWPLYLYVQDDHAKQTSNINIDQFGGNWPAISAKTGAFVPRQSTPS
jgi:predicted lipoprotein with Yx(FWY)xxD motif